MIKKLLNPVGNYDATILLMVGVVLFGLNIVSGYFLGFQMNSIVHVGLSESSLKIVAYSALRSVVLAILLYFLAGLIINKRTRIVDIINTVLIATIPLLISSVLMSFSSISEIVKTNSPPTAIDLTFLFFVLLVLLPLILYSIAILYNGFKTATNLKTGYHIGLFVFTTVLLAVFTPFIF